MDKIKKIRQEIKRRIALYSSLSENTVNPNRIDEDIQLLSFLDTLEEPVSEDLEEAAEKYSDKYCSDWAYRLEYEDAFIAGAEWAVQHLK